MKVWVAHHGWVETQISPFSSREGKRATQIFPSPASPLSRSTARPWRLERQLPRMPPGQPAANRGNLHRVRTPHPRSELRLLQAPAMEELIPAPVAPCRQPRPHKRVRAGELPPAARSSSMPVAAPATRRPRRRPPEQLRADSSIDGAPAAGQAQARQGFGSRRETTERGRIFGLSLSFYAKCVLPLPALLEAGFSLWMTHFGFG